MIKVRPFLKWAGSKYSFVETILNAFPMAERLIEPFTGSGAVFVNANFQQYLLAEQNKDLIALFKYLQEGGDEFIDYCAELFCEENNCPDKYYELRDKFNQSSDSKQRAAIFLYLNRHGYNGLCRYNKKGGYNVPFGLYDKIYFPRKEMYHFQEKSKFAHFIQSDFRDTFALAQEGDLIYCDPPYVPLSKSADFTSYTHQLFTEKDQLDLVRLAEDCASRKITVVISNHDTPFIRHHYRHSQMLSLSVKRKISCNANQRNLVQELIAVFK